MDTTDIGRQAETAAADYLKSKGYEIIDNNWRTRWCEIDIVAKKHRTVVFTEVKYRKSSSWGDGLDAITPKKLQQMSFAAELWVSSNDWRGDYGLIAISTSGCPPIVQDLIEL
jgi:uncharacterized protein (TIGR00252 family)